MTDLIEQIRQREAEHQQLHERDASIPSCLPAGCSPDQGDVPVLLREVDRLRETTADADSACRFIGDLGLGIMFSAWLPAEPSIRAHILTECSKAIRPIGSGQLVQQPPNETVTGELRYANGQVIRADDPVSVYSMEGVAVAHGTSTGTVRKLAHPKVWDSVLVQNRVPLLLVVSPFLSRCHIASYDD